MDELINQITQRTGISEEQAREAVTMALNFLKTKLPPAMATQIDSVIAGQTLDNLSEQAQNMLGGMFGKK